MWRNAVLRLGAADLYLTVAHPLDAAELVAHRLVGGNILGAVDLLGNGADLHVERHVVGIEQLELALAAVADLDYGARDVGGALAALGPMVRHDGLDAELLGVRLPTRDIGVGIGAEAC